MKVVPTFEYALSILNKLSLNDFEKIKGEIPKIEINIIKKQEIKNHNISCPFCKSNRIKKNGHCKNGTQKYVCLEETCKKSFNERTNTLLYRTKKLNDKLALFLECFINKDTIRNTARKCEVSLSTSLIWRNKIGYLSKMLFQRELAEEVEFDETFTPFNFKGTKTKNMPRKSKKRGGRTVSHRELICIGMAIDSNDNLHTAILGNNIHPTFGRLNTNFSKVIEKGTVFICDGENGLERFCKNNHLLYECVDPDTHKSNNNYTINTINGIHSEYKLFLKQFKGVSTRHIESYVYWFRLNKLLKYFIENENKLAFLYEEFIRLNTSLTIFQFRKFHRRPYRVRVYDTYKNHKGTSWEYLKESF